MRILKYIVFGGFDYAVYYEMEQDAIFQGIDYFVDNDPNLIGTTYLGKEIKHPDVLLDEDRENMLILIGSIVYRTEMAFQLKDMGFEEEKDFIWAIEFCGNTDCPRLWRHIEWSDKTVNAANLDVMKNSEIVLSRLKVASRLIDFGRIDTVIDLGAANERIKAFLPKQCRYIPVDYIRYSEQTLIFNLDQYEFPTPERVPGGYNPEGTCIVSMGNLQHVRDWKWYLGLIAENCTYLIWGHDDFVRLSREYRKTKWVRQNALFDHQVIIHMCRLGFELVDAVDFRLKTTIYRFEKRGCICRR